jgi:hypothetical protein
VRRWGCKNGIFEKIGIDYRGRGGLPSLLTPDMEGIVNWETTSRRRDRDPQQKLNIPPAKHNPCQGTLISMP